GRVRAFVGLLARGGGRRGGARDSQGDGGGGFSEVAASRRVHAGEFVALPRWRHQKTGTSESTSSPAIAPLKARSARGARRNRPMVAPKPPHSATEIRQPVASTTAISALSHTTSPPTVLKAASAPRVDTQALGLSQVIRIASKKPIGRARLVPAL